MRKVVRRIANHPLGCHRKFKRLNLTAMNNETTKILDELEQRVADMFVSDLETGEHKDASPLDYVRWAIEEIEANHQPILKG